jgi:hypothetical protein
MKKLDFSIFFVLCACLVMTAIGLNQVLRKVVGEHAVCGSLVSGLRITDTIQSITAMALVWFGWRTWLVFSRQASIMDRQAAIDEKQATIAHQNYLQTHRPKLRVRNIVIKGSLFVMGFPVRGQFYIDNVGGTNATVEESHCEILWNVAGLPMERPYEGQGFGHEVKNFISKGTVIKGSVGTTAQFDTSPAPYPTIEPPGITKQNRAFFMGWIDYRDDTGLLRRTAFCREFQQRNGSARFYRTNDKDYDFEG